MVNIESPHIQDRNIVDTQDYASLELLTSAVTQSAAPVLVITSASELQNILSILRDEDDICLRDSPQVLKQFRLDRMQSKGHSNDNVNNSLDPLTQVSNRQSFMETLDHFVSTATCGQPVSVILCDIDDFKRLNCEFGHAAGDEVLMLIADCFRTTAGSKTTIGRLGGDEFAFVGSLKNQQAKDLADALRDSVSRIPQHDGNQLTLSLGVATTSYPMPGSELLDKSTEALYAAKSNGRDRWNCIGDLEAQSRLKGHDVSVAGLENMARVLAERVANVITMKSRKLLSHARNEADVDGLTGCFNRRYLDRRLESEFNGRAESQLSVAFLDLDHFGQVNKSYGWSTGDKLLVEVCDTIRDHIREDDWIGRYGGEEFCIVMPDTNRDECQAILARIRRTIERTEFTSVKSGNPVSVTVSIGATSAIRDDSSFSDMLERASEMALFAKNSGRNQVCMSKA